MACDGTRVFVLGGKFSPGVLLDEAKLIHVLDTSMYFLFVSSFGQPSSLKQSSSFTPKPDSNAGAVKHGEKTTQLVQKLSASQPQQPTFSLSDSDVHPEHSTSPFQKSTLEDSELDHSASLQIGRERNYGSIYLPSLLSRMDDKPRRAPEDDNDDEGSTEHHRKLVVPDAYSEKAVARLEHERIANLERQLSETVAAKNERDRHIAQLFEQLA